MKPTASRPKGCVMRPPSSRTSNDTSRHVPISGLSLIGEIPPWAMSGDVIGFSLPPGRVLVGRVRIAVEAATRLHPQLAGGHLVGQQAGRRVPRIARFRMVDP